MDLVALTDGDRETNGVHPSSEVVAIRVDGGNQGVVGSSWVDARGVLGLIPETRVHGVEESMVGVGLTMVLG